VARGAGPARTGAPTGYSLLELMFVVSLLLMLTAITVPQVLVSIEDFRAAGAARYMQARLYEARLAAVTRTTAVAVQFTQTSYGYRYAVYQDGNGNGMRTADITRGIDPLIQAPEGLPDNFAGVDFGTLPNLPAIDSGGTAPGTDPIRFGSSSLLTFTPLGEASSGTLYIRGRRNTQFALRVLGGTGRIRLLQFDVRTNKWRQL
jgi:type II secretory pathway pseudopilin PulG